MGSLCFNHLCEREPRPRFFRGCGTRVCNHMNTLNTLQAGLLPHRIVVTWSGADVDLVSSGVPCFPRVAYHPPTEAPGHIRVITALQEVTSVSLSHRAAAFVGAACQVAPSQPRVCLCALCRQRVSSFLPHSANWGRKASERQNTSESRLCCHWCEPELFIHSPNKQPSSAQSLGLYLPSQPT